MVNYWKFENTTKLSLDFENWNRLNEVLFSICTYDIFKPIFHGVVWTLWSPHYHVLSVICILFRFWIASVRTGLSWINDLGTAWAHTTVCGGILVLLVLRVFRIFRLRLTRSTRWCCRRCGCTVCTTLRGSIIGPSGSLWRSIFIGHLKNNCV